jgi:hypothetical protein
MPTDNQTKIEKKTYIWLFIIVFAVVFTSTYTALFFGDKHKALFGTIFSFVALLASFFVNAGTEEYSLPFLMVSFYIFTKYFFVISRNYSFFPHFLFLGEHK